MGGGYLVGLRVRSKGEDDSKALLRQEREREREREREQERKGEGER